MNQPRNGSAWWWHVSVFVAQVEGRPRCSHKDSQTAEEEWNGPYSNPLIAHVAELNPRLEKRHIP